MTTEPTIKPCAVCGSKGYELPFATDFIACNRATCALGGGMRFDIWNALSDARALWDAVEMLSAQPYIYARAFAGFDVIDIRVEDETLPLAAAFIALAAKIKEGQG